MLNKKVKAVGPRFAQGEHVIDQNAIENIQRNPKEIAQIATMVKRVLDDDDYEPPMLPEIAISLTKLANQPEVDFAQVERVVSKDPAVAAKIVSVANSAFYSRGQAVRSLGLAIARLGLALVRDVAFQVVAQTTIFKVPEYAGRMRELFRAAQLSGVLAKEVCVKLKFESEMAYLCGLLHDMGQPIILAIVARECKRKKMDLFTLDQLQTVIEQLHPQVGAMITREWGLPDIISNALLYHHKHSDAEDAAQMAAVVAIADVLLRHIGVGVAKQPVDAMSESIFYQLNLTPDQVNELLQFAEEIAKEEI